MGYTKSQIVSTISGTSTASPILSTTGTFAGHTYNNFDHANWAWNPNLSIESSALPYTDNPADAGTFQQRPFKSNGTVVGLTPSTPIFTFNGEATRKLAFRTKISGQFTLDFKIIAGGNTTNSTQTDKIRISNGGALLFGHPNGNWIGTDSSDHNVKIAYNTSSFLSGTGTWVAIRSLHAFAGAGSPDFSTQEFTTISVTFTLPAEAYVGIIQQTVKNFVHSTDCRWAVADVRLTYKDPSIDEGYNTIEVSDFTDHWNEMQCFLNGNITSSDISTTPWVETYHMKPMRFFGSPAPRVEAISGDVHYRREKTSSHLYAGQGEIFMAIAGLATTIHVAPPFIDQQPRALVRCSFFAEESGNTTAEEPESNDLCEFALLAKHGNAPSEIIDGSRRTLYQEEDGKFYGGKNFSIINIVRLSVGVNHIYVGVWFSDNVQGRGRVRINQKSIVVDVKYL